MLDDGLKANIAQRDAGVAQVYSTFLSAALQEPAVKIVVTFGLSDRYTWLQEDFPGRTGQHVARCRSTRTSSRSRRTPRS